MLVVMRKHVGNGPVCPNSQIAEILRTVLNFAPHHGYLTAGGLLQTSPLMFRGRYHRGLAVPAASPLFCIPTTAAHCVDFEGDYPANVGGLPR